VRLLRYAAGALALTLTLATGGALAQDYTVGSIKISQVWTREVPKGSKVAAGFMTLTNTGKEADTLIGGSSTVAGKFEVHEMKMDDGIMKMRELQPGLVIKPGETVVLKPGSFHIMLLDLKEAPKHGTPVKGTLTFARAGKIDVEYQVAPLGARALDDSKPQGGRPHSRH
jgi:periplasmic copper chaperone A